MKVAFDCHVPFALAHGGVQVQIEQTKAALMRQGIEVQMLPWWDDSITPDLIHFFGRPSLSYVELVRQKRIRLVIADLLTSQGSRKMWQRLPFKIVCQFDRLLGGGIRQKIGWSVYDRADCCVCLTSWEASLIRDLYGARNARLEVVPNGVEGVFLETRSDLLRGDHLVTTVTITPRKRVVELVEAAARAQVKLHIIGKPYHPEDPYHLLFLKALTQAHPWVRYHGAIENRVELANQYRKAAGFVLLSSMESQSLSALEAAACGCPLLLSDLPWARSTFGQEASYAPLATRERTAIYLREFLDRLPSVPRVKKVPSWDEVAERLARVYREATTSR